MKIREIASGLQFPEGPVALPDGSLILVEIARGTLTRVAADGEVSVIADLGGGPNGVAIGPDGHAYVCNNGGFKWHRDDRIVRPIGQADDYSGGRIERVDLNTGRSERIYDSFDARDGQTRQLRGPNDIVFDAQGGFWFTDLGKGRARDIDRGGIYYGTASGAPLREVAYPALTPNGIGLSPDGRTVYYAETETARLWALDLKAPGEIERHPFPSPNGARLIGQPGRVFQRFDSLKVDSTGHILVATLMHGGITRFSPDGNHVVHTPMPDIYTTNLCFGGADLRTLYVTLSGQGRVIAIDEWPVAGLRLNFL